MINKRETNSKSKVFLIIIGCFVILYYTLSGFKAIAAEKTEINKIPKIPINLPPSNFAMDTQQALNGLSPDSPEYYFALGSTYTYHGKYQEASEEFNKAWKLAKQDPSKNMVLSDTLSELAYVYQKLNLLDKAYTCITTLKTVPYNGNTTFGEIWAYHLKLGDYYMYKSEWDNARGEYRRAIQKNPNDSQGYKGIGWAYGMQGNHDQALVYFKKYIELTPDNFEPYLLTGEAYYNKMMDSEATMYLQKAINMNPYLYHKAYLKLANAYRGDWLKTHDAHSFYGAEQNYQKAFAINSTYPYTYVDYGTFLYEQGKQQDGLSYFYKALTLDSSNDEAHCGVGRYYYDNQEYDKALEEFSKSIATNPKYPYVYYYLSKYYSEVKQDQKLAKLNINKYNQLLPQYRNSR